MAIIDCNKHGVCGVSLLCEHLSNALATQRQTSVERHETNDVVAKSIFLCVECSTTLKLSNGEPTDQLLDTLTPVCGKCFREWQQIE